MAKLPFSLFKRAGRRFFYVSFKNAETGEYLPAISTKQESESGAVERAFQWLKDGIPRRGEAVPLKKYTLRDMAREADIGQADCEYICKELRRRGLLESYVLSGSKQSVPFTEYLLDFWDWEKSAYIRERLRKNHGLHRRYTTEMRGAVSKYWVPLFPKKMLGEVTGEDVESLITSLETFQGKPGVGPKSAKRKNIIIQAGTVPLKWAFHKGLIELDATGGITWFSGKQKERQILTPEQAAAVFRVPWKDDRPRVANMLSMVTGMRAGEIQGLRVQDLGRDCLYVRHSWNYQDGLKTTKNNEVRTVEVPFPSLMAELLMLAGGSPHGQGMDGYVFWAEKLPSKPIESGLFLQGLREALVKIGMSEAAAGTYTFHGWRHYFTSYMRERVNAKLLKSQTGHKSDSMLALYSKHVIAGDRDQIRDAQRAVFGGLLPGVDFAAAGA
jgi:integrase